MREIILLLCLLVVVPFQAPAQSDNSSLPALVDQVQHAYDNNSDSLQFYASQAFQLAVKLHDIGAEIKVQTLLATRLFLNGQSDKATKILLDVARDAEKMPLTLESAHLFYTLAQVYGKNNYYAIAEDYMRRGIAIAVQFNNEDVLADGYNRMGVIFENKNLYDSALYCYNQGLIHYSNTKGLLGQAYSLENIAGIYALQRKFREALVYQERALAYKEQTGKKVDLAIAYINLGETFDSLREQDSSIAYIKKALALANEIDYKDLIKYSFGYLSMIYERAGNYQLALAYHKRFASLNDTIYTEAKARQLAELNTKYQTEKKEQQIRELAQKTTIQRLQLRQRNIVLLVAAILFLAAAAIGYLAYNRRKLKAQAALQAEINRQQAITTREVFFAEERERKRIAADLHDGVGQMLSATLLNLNNFFTANNISRSADEPAGKILSLVTESYDELRSISHQMMPSALLKSGLAAALKELVARTGNSGLHITLGINGLSARINEDVETVLYRVIQECISNVIKHAGATTLNIQLLKDEDGISVTIEDNGKGFNTQTAGKGIGFKNIYSRLQFHNGTVDIDSSPGRGTLVAIHLPAS